MKKKLQRDAKTITNNAQCSKRVKASDKYKTMTNSCSISSCVVSLSVSGVGGLELEIKLLVLWAASECQCVKLWLNKGLNFTTSQQKAAAARHPH